jgi:hypothetical protein
LIKPHNNFIKVVCDDENWHPNIAKNKQSKDITNVFTQVISPKEIKYSSSKRYHDHFNEEDKQNDEYSENDLLYEICNNEKRPSKEVTSNTELTTMREDSRVYPRDLMLDGSSLQEAKPKWYLMPKNSKSTKEISREYKNIEIKPKLGKKNLDTISSPNFRPRNGLNIEDITNFAIIDISEKNTEKTKIKKREEENYETDIRALKKRLDFLNNSNWRLIESSLKHNNYKNVTRSNENAEPSQTWSVYTERYSNEESIETSRTANLYGYKPDEKFSKSKIKLGFDKSIEPGHSRNIDMSNLPGSIMNDKMLRNIPKLSPRTLISLFVTHDDTIKERIEAEFSNQKQLSSGRKSHKINTCSNNSATNSHMKFKTKKSKHNIYGNKFNVSKLWVRSNRNSTVNHIGSKKHKDFAAKKINVKSKDGRASNAHSISIETQFNKYASLYEWSTQQVSAIKISSHLISENKRYNAVLKDSSSIDHRKNLFPKTMKNKTKGRSKRNSNLMLNISRNPSVSDSRYSSSVITVQKPYMKSRLFKYKKTKKGGIPEIHSNKSNSSMRKTWTPLYMLRHGQENFKKTISGYYDHNKKSKSKSNLSKSKKIRCNSKKKKNNGDDAKRPSSALGHIKHKNLRPTSNKSKHLKNNESLKMEKHRSKENTIRHDDVFGKASWNSSKSYMKINGFDKIISSIRKRSKSKEGFKNLSKVDAGNVQNLIISEYTINNDQLRYSTGINNMFSQQYAFLNKSKAPSISISTRNLSLDKNDQSSLLKMTGNEATTHFLKNYNLIKKKSKAHQDTQK